MNFVFVWNWVSYAYLITTSYPFLPLLSINLSILFQGWHMVPYSGFIPIALPTQPIVLDCNDVSVDTEIVRQYKRISYTFMTLSFLKS
jgi:hypothetical protein